MGLFDRFKRKSKDDSDDDADDRDHESDGEDLIADLDDDEMSGPSDERVAATDNMDIRNAVAETLDHLEANTADDDDDDDEDVDGEVTPRHRSAAYDDDDDEEDEESGGGLASIAGRLPQGRAGLIAVAVGAFFLVSVVTGGIAWFLVDGEETPVAEVDNGSVVGMALPPPAASGLTPPVGGGLNAIGIGAGSETAAAKDAGMTMSSEQAASGGSENQSGDSARDSLVPNPDGETVAEEGLNAFAVAGGNTRQAGADITVSVTTSAAFDIMLDRSSDAPLRTEPDSALLEQVDGGVMVPRIVENRTSFQTYSRPSNPPEGQPRVAIVVAGLGLSRAATEAAILKLPGNISLSFDVYAANLEPWLAEAWAQGHEVLISLPMESEAFPNEDAGPLALRTDISVSDNIVRLNAMMGRFRGFIGMQTVMGSKFMATEDKISPILETLKGRGLMILESNRDPRSLVPRLATEMGLARAFTDIELDVSPSKTAISDKLLELEALARQKGVAVGISHALPSALERIAEWATAAEQRGISVVPISSIAGARRSDT